MVLVLQEATAQGFTLSCCFGLLVCFPHRVVSGDEQT